jgi:acetyl esterase/lipase
MAEVINLKPATVMTSTLTTPGTTAAVLEALSKAAVELTATTEAPETGKLCEDATIGHKAQLKFSGSALAGKTIVVSPTSHALHIYGTTASSNKRLKIGGTSPTLSATPSMANEWVKVQLTEAEAAELNTAAKIEAWVVYLETIEAKTWKVYDFYLSVTVESGTPVHLEAKTAIKLGVSADLEVPGSNVQLAARCNLEVGVTARLSAPEKGDKFNVEYGAGGSERVLDAYLAKQPNSKIAVNVHGGGWKEGDKSECDAECEYLRSQGFAVLNINYREATEIRGAFPQQCEDLEAAIAWAKAHAAELNGNPNAIVLLGGSSGAHVVAITACRMNNPAVREIATLSAPFDLPKLLAELREEEGEEKVIGEPEKLAKNLMSALQCTPIGGETGSGCKTTAKIELAEQFSATRQATPTSLKWLMFNGNKEKIPVAHINAMKAHLEAEGRKVTAYILDSEKHAYANWNHKLTGTGETAPTVAEAIVSFFATPELQASCSIQVGAHGTLNQKHNLAGTCHLSTGAAGTLQQKQSLTASSHISAGATASIAIATHLQAQTAIKGGLQASLQQRQGLEAVTHLQVGAAGSISHPTILAAQVHISIGVAAVLAGNGVPGSATVEVNTVNSADVEILLP